VIEGVEACGIRVPIDWPSRGDTRGVRLGTAFGLSLGDASGLSFGATLGFRCGTTFGLNRGATSGFSFGGTLGLSLGEICGLSCGDLCGLSCGDLCGLRVGGVCERGLLDGGSRLNVTGLRGVMTIGCLGVDGVRTVGLLREKLLRKFKEGLRLICGVRLIFGADRKGLLVRGRLSEGRGVDIRGSDRDGLLMRGRLIDGRGIDMRGAARGVEGRLGADFGADRLAALLADGLRRACPCAPAANHRTAAAVRNATTVLERVFFV
jgi:hypothetical protein